MEGVDVENLLPILTVSNATVNVVANPIPPDIDVNPVASDFGAVPVGGSITRTFTVRNRGARSLSVTRSSLMGMNANQFSFVSGGGAFTLTSGQSREVVVRYSPTSPGSKSAILFFLSNDPDETLFYVPLTASTAAPDIDVQPLSVDFGDVLVGSMVSRTLVIRNTGNAPLHLTQFGLDGHQNQFAYNIGLLAILDPGQSANVTVYFNPTTEGAKNASLIIHSNDPDEVAVTVSLAGRGVQGQ
jgi:Abnormal spindle-like microcephaly-assoc'd, ASPM-SPD-2-Hydin